MDNVVETHDSNCPTAPNLFQLLSTASNCLPSQINYGGRVTDDNDRRLLMCILGRCYSPEALIEGHPFTPSGTYRSPVDADHASYLAHIKALPQRDEPEVFGLNSNANITFNLQVGMASRGAIGGGNSRSANSHSFLIFVFSLFCRRPAVCWTQSSPSSPGWRVLEGARAPKMWFWTSRRTSRSEIG